MNVNDLMNLAAEEREDAEVPVRWLEVVEGRASAEALAEREAEDALLLRSLLPMSEEDEQAIVAKLLAEPTEAPIPKKRQPRRARWHSRAAVAIASIAAALLLFVAVPSKNVIPSYHLEAATADQTMRSAAAPAAKPRHHVESALTIILRPASATEDVAVRAFIQTGDGIVAWSPRLEVSPTGAIRLDGIAGQLLPGRSGELTLLFAVGRPDRLPTGANVLDHGDWRLLRYPMELIR